MPLVLRQAQIVGMHSTIFFRDPSGTVDRVVVSTEEHDDIKADVDDTQAYWLKGRSIRPRTRARMYKATRGPKFDTADGFLAPGDYFVQDGVLIIQLPVPTDRRSLPMLMLEPEEWRGDPTRPDSLRANTTLGDGFRVRISNGELL